MKKGMEPKITFCVYLLLTILRD